ncbi:MAG: hypothetical protein PXY39_04265 [archaeon]|nr:hypothetical protein [archaeon]
MKTITIVVLAVALAIGLPLTLLSSAMWNPYYIGHQQAPAYQSQQGYGGMMTGMMTSVQH